MYERKREFEDGRMEMKGVVQGPFNAQWVNLPQDNLMRCLEAPAWNLPVTPLPSAVGERQAFPYDRVTDMDELIAAVDLINAMVSVSSDPPLTAGYDPPNSLFTSLQVNGLCTNLNRVTASVRRMIFPEQWSILLGTCST